MGKVFQTKDRFITIIRNKKSGFACNIGYECGDSCNCAFHDKCKYARPAKNGWYFYFREWFYHRTYITLPWLPFHFGKNWVELSGTSKCPFGTTERTGCHKCKNCGGTDACCHLICGLPKTQGRRPKYEKDDFWGYQCKDFEPYEDN